jgi:hypothetical protein
MPTNQIYNVWPNLLRELNKIEKNNDKITNRAIWLKSLLNNETYNDLIIRSKDGLRVFKYSRSSNDWSCALFDNRFSDELKFNEAAYKLKFLTVKDKSLISFLSANNGFIFLAYDRVNNKLVECLTDKLFTRRYEQLEFGWFYGTSGPMGLFAVHKEEGVSFHFLDLSSKNKPLCRVNFLNEYILELIKTGKLNWNHKTMNFHFSSVTNGPKTHIITQHANGLSIYDLIDAVDSQRNKVLKPIVIAEVVISIGEHDKFWFTNLTPCEQGSLIDLAVLKADGLRIFQFNSAKRTYEFVLFSDQFSEKNGWNLMHTHTIQFCDYDNSGCAKMFHTGPNGFKIEKLRLLDNSAWVLENLVDFEFNSNANEKFMIPVEIIPRDQSPSGNAVVISSDLVDNKLIFFDIDKYESIIVNENETMQTNTQSNIPKVQTSQPALENQMGTVHKSVLSLIDTIDMKSITSSAVNVTNGAVNLQIPLIKFAFLTEPVIRLDYSSTFSHLSSPSSTLGLGWQMPLEMITADFRSNKFAHVYVLLESGTTLVKLDLEQESPNGVKQFKIENNKYFKVSYYSNEKCWRVVNKIDGFTKTYGGQISAANPRGNGIEWHIGWKNWLGKGTSNKNQYLYETKWYLTNISNEKDGISVDFNYKEVTSEAADKQSRITTNIYLEKITANGNQSVIDLIYESELLKQIKYESPFQMQTIGFNFANSNKASVLESIAQVELSNFKVLEFSYQKFPNSLRLNSVLFPNKQDKLAFDYELCNSVTNMSPFECLKSKSIYLESNSSQIKVGCSLDYMVNSYCIKNSEIKLNLFNKANAIGDHIEIQAPVSQSIVEHAIKTYQLFTFSNYFLVYIFDNDLEKHSIVLYHKVSHSCTSWALGEVVFLKNIKALCFNNDLVSLVLKNGEFLVLEWDDAKNKWYKSFETSLKSTNETLMLINEENTILVYDNSSFYLAYRNLQDKWSMKSIASKPGYISDLNAFIDSFDVKKEMRDQTVKHLKQNLLHFSKNIIVANRVFIRNNTFHSVVSIFMLNENLDLVLEKEIAESKPMSDINHELESEFVSGEKVKYELMYKYINGKYAVQFKSKEVSFEFDYRNKEYKRIYVFCGNEIKVKIKDHHGYDVKDSEQKIPIGEDFSWFLIKLDDLFVKLSENVIKHGEDEFRFDGSEWIINKKSTTEIQSIIEVGDYFNLVKEEYDNATWKLLNKNKTLMFDFGIKDLTRIFIALPYYIAFVSLSNSILVLPINKDKVGDEFLLAHGEYIVQGSNQYLLAVKLNGRPEIKFFPTPCKVFEDQIDNARIVKKTLTIDAEKYEKGYRYDESTKILRYNGVLSYLKSKIYPGNDLGSFGCIEYDSGSEASKIFINYYDTEENLVKIEETDLSAGVDSSDVDEHDDEELNEKDSTLYSSFGKNILAEFGNASIKSDEAAYLGFDKDDIYHNWEINKEECKRDNIGLVGKSFLRLGSANSQLTRTFRPLNLKIAYECSCWVRVNQSLVITEEFKEFSATIIETGQVMNSEILSKHEDWYFLKITIDLVDIQQKLKQNNLSIRIKIKPSTKFALIDVDHVLFKPLNGRSQISVYDEHTKQVLASIKENNLITHMIYDSSYQPIAVADSNNQLKIMNFSYNNSKSIVNIEASNAVYLNYSDYALGYYWSIKNPNDFKRNHKMLIHSGAKSFNDVVLVRKDVNLNKTSTGVYFKPGLLTPESILVLQLNLHQITFKSNEINLNNKIAIKINNKSINKHYLIIAEHDRLIIWENNYLIFDRSFSQFQFSGSSEYNLSFKVFKPVEISNILVLNEPRIEVKHLNGIGSLKQIIKLENSNTVIITERLYDKLEREAIITKATRVLVQENEQSLAYRKDFITNSLFSADPSCFWKTKKLIGLVSNFNKEDNGFCYYRNTYSNDPLDHIQSVDLPGEKFSNQLSHVKVFQTEDDENTSYTYFKFLFPVKDGFISKTVMLANGNRTVTFFDRNKNKVALFNHSVGFQDILTTYEYDENNNLVKILPPLYHSNDEILTLDECTRTFKELNAMWNSNSKALELQKQLASTYKYKNDLLIESYTPECGRQVYIYSKESLLRFVLKYNKQNKPYRAEFLNYNNYGEVCEKGFSTNSNLGNV